MKVLQLVHDFPPNSWKGTEIYTLGLSLALRRLGLDVEVLFPAHRRGSLGVDLLDMGGLPVLAMDLPLSSMNGRAVKDHQAAVAAVDLAIARGADVLHVQHTLRFSAEVLEEAHRRGLPTVLSLHDFWLICHRAFLLGPSLEPCPGWGEENCLRCLAAMHGADDARALGHLLAHHRARTEYHRRVLALPGKVLAVSRHVAGVFGQAAMSPPGLSVMPAGIVPFGLEPAPAKPPGAPLEFVCLGAVSPMKGTLEAARAFAALEGCRLRIHGGGLEGPYLEAVRDLCRRHPGNLSYEGPYDPARRGAILAGCDAVVVPSLSESYCLTVREALFAGKPVLASNVGGIPEAVIHGRNGLLFPAGDWQALRRLALELAAEPRRLAALAAGVGPVRVVDQDARQLAKLYGRLAGGS